MKCLVIGNNGQVATALSQVCRKGLEVVRIGRPEIDLLNPKDFAKKFLKFSPDIIINPAAYTSVDQAEEESEMAFAVNMEGSGAVAAAAKEIGVPCIYLSTDYVFDGSGDIPICEESTPRPLNVYGKSKLAGEAKVISCMDNYVILRTAWVYSMFGKNFLRSMLQATKDRHQVDVVCDQFGTPTSASQIAIAIIDIAYNLIKNSDMSLRGIFHMTASDGPISWADFAENIFLISQERGGKPVRIRRILTSQYPVKACRPMYSCLDCSKLTRVHNIRISSWKDEIRHVIPQF
ncbi:MAG: dTDP-4-dehydrorhamnose reductase [Candidatus Liberibacter ctenarytainae]|uniref:dTDP-4-dehydrorhamnose reductase n=1 Tax=Candidatus Liberibacter ctenarytainae TaxID=2020335 RepID=A0A937AD46_9HYPH|nr:dTDP-4-dehydrorhamnose reductase [Candidatus Liberibacter ctenarytainae]